MIDFGEVTLLLEIRGLIDAKHGRLPTNSTPTKARSEQQVLLQEADRGVPILSPRTGRPEQGRPHHAELIDCVTARS